MKKLLNVTDLSAYLFCPRKYYLEKVKGMRQPPNRRMIEGKLRHDILEIFSKNERELVIKLDEKELKELTQEYLRFFNNLVNHHLEKNKVLVYSFKIVLSEFKDKLIQGMQSDIKLRVETIKKAMQQGFLKETLWENLQPKYASEMVVVSEELGLKGRIDRVMFDENKIIPFELKTREIQKVYPSDEIQLSAYAMLLEEKFKTKIPTGIIEAGNEKYEIEITDDFKNKVLEVIEKINNISQNIPYPSNFSKCQTCFLKEQCDELKIEG